MVANMTLFSTSGVQHVSCIWVFSLIDRRCSFVNYKEVRFYGYRYPLIHIDYYDL